MEGRREVGARLETPITTHNHDRCTSKLISILNVDGRIIDDEHTCMYFRCVSSLSTWAICCAKIFSLPVRAWIPTIVTPMGQGALPMAMDK